MKTSEEGRGCKWGRGEGRERGRYLVRERVQGEFSCLYQFLTVFSVESFHEIIRNMLFQLFQTRIGRWPRRLWPWRRILWPWRRIWSNLWWRYSMLVRVSSTTPSIWNSIAINTISEEPTRILHHIFFSEKKTITVNSTPNHLSLQGYPTMKRCIFNILNSFVFLNNGNWMNSNPLRNEDFDNKSLKSVPD